MAARPDAPPIAQLVRLLSPRAIGMRNTVLRGGRRWMYAGLTALGLLFWLILFATMYALVSRFWAVDGFGPFLARKLLEMRLASLFTMLCFSNVVTALSTYYLSEDLELVLSLPVDRSTFPYARFLDTLGQSSWMMGLFGLPVFLAYGIAIGASAAYYVALLLAIPALLVLACNIGVIVATILVNVFSARRTRELMVLMGFVALAALFVLIRTLRPERLVRAEEFENLAEWLDAVRVPAPVLFPPRWATEVLANTLLYAPFPWTEALLLGFGAVASMGVARWVVLRGFDGGWVMAQEAREARFHTSRVFDTLALVVPRRWRPIVSKELRVFVRDPSQWSQVFLLGGVCAIYLVSVATLPLDMFTGELLTGLKQALAFLNLGMGGFVMAAIAARFQFTAVSREGRSWWVLRGAPVEPTTVLFAKAAVGLIPMFVVGEVVVVGSGLVLDAPRWLLALQAFVTVGLATGISGLAIAMGAWWPDFRADSAAHAASGPAAMFFMVSALMLVFVVMLLVGLGVAAGLWSGGVTPVAVALVAAALGVCVTASIWPVRRAARDLWAQGLP